MSKRALRYTDRQFLMNTDLKLSAESKQKILKGENITPQTQINNISVVATFKQKVKENTKNLKEQF